MTFRPAALFLVLLLAGPPGFAGSGVLEADALILPSREVSLSLPTEAILRDVRVREGELVRKGSVLATLYTRVEELERESAARRLELAEFQLQASERLRASAAVSEEQARQRVLDRDLARIEALRAEAVLGEKTLVAPFDGYILRVHKEAGETVGRVDRIIDIVDLKTLHVDAYLEGDWIQSIEKGANASVSIPKTGAKDLVARVELIDPVVDPASGLFRVRLTLPNPDLEIPSGLPARVAIPVSGKVPQKSNP